MPRSGRPTGLARSGHLRTEGSRSNGSWRQPSCARGSEKDTYSTAGARELSSSRHRDRGSRGHVARFCEDGRAQLAC
ncbi:hypothetical protein MTO96_001491 [Rhipicephalus appendiculatus]